MIFPAALMVAAVAAANRNEPKNTYAQVVAGAVNPFSWTSNSITEAPERPDGRSNVAHALHTAA